MRFVSNAKYSEPVENGTIFRGKVGNMRIIVHRMYHYEGWYLSVPDLMMDGKKLKSDSLIGAINESKSVLKQISEKINKDVSSFCEAEIEISRD